MRHSSANRDRGGRRFLYWLALALAGVGGGIMLGEMVVGGRLHGLDGTPPAYSSLSANPDALVADGDGAPACLDCADSYGIAARLRARRDDRMNDAFRELGAVDSDQSLPDEAIDDDYRYGGRFPDPEPRDRVQPTPAQPLPAAPPMIVPPAGDVPADTAMPIAPPIAPPEED